MVAPGDVVDLGVRPNSPMAMTRVSSSRPRPLRSSISGRERLVGRWDQVVLEPAEERFRARPSWSVARIVLAVVNRDEPDAGLDQAAGQEHALPELGAAVAVAQLRVFRTQVKRPSHRR